MGRTQPVTMYFTDEEKAAIESEANAEGETVSTYCRNLLQRQRQEERGDELAEQLGVEARIDNAIREGIAEMTDVAADLQEMNRQMGSYTIANFVLSHDSEPEGRKREAFNTANRRLKTPLSEHDLSSASDSDSEPVPDGDDGDESDLTGAERIRRRKERNTESTESEGSER